MNDKLSDCPTFGPAQSDNSKDKDSKDSKDKIIQRQDSKDNWRVAVD